MCLEDQDSREHSMRDRVTGSFQTNFGVRKSHLCKFVDLAWHIIWGPHGLLSHGVVVLWPCLRMDRLCTLGLTRSQKIIRQNQIYLWYTIHTGWMYFSTWYLLPIVVNQQCAPCVLPRFCPSRWCALRISKIQARVGSIIWRNLKKMPYRSLGTSFRVLNNSSPQIVK